MKNFKPTLVRFGAIMAGGLLYCAASTVQASVIVEVEAPAGSLGDIANNTTATAQAIGAVIFTMPEPATVFPRPGSYTATVTGFGADNAPGNENDVDFFSFSTIGPGANRAMFDIDDPAFDTRLALYDNTATLIAINDDSSPADLGSSTDRHSFIGEITLAPGDYFIAISIFDNEPTPYFLGICDDGPAYTRPDSEFGGLAQTNCTIGDDSYSDGTGPNGGEEYTLHISLQPVTTVSEPGTLAILALGLAGLGFARRRKQAA